MAQRASTRLAKACVIVAVVVLAVPVSGSIAQVAENVRGTGAMLKAASDPVVSDASTSQDSLGASYEAAECSVESADEDAVATFQGEVLSLAGLEDVRVNETCSVVGYATGESAGDALDGLAGQLERNGWMQVESGSDAAASFVKQTGALTWLFASCTTVGDETAVVICTAGLA